MMSLKNLTDKVLLENTKALVKQEQETLVQVLHHLREIDRRKSFSSWGYKSLYDFAERNLGYPKDQAYRRIAAMKLLRELPEIESKISQGDINLTHIGMVQKLFNDEKAAQNLMTASEKLEVFEEISKTSTRVAEKIILSKSSNPEPPKPDKVRAITESKIELKFQASSELREKIEKLKGRLAHKYPNLSSGELFEKLCDLGLETWDPGQKPPRKSKVVQGEELIAKDHVDKEKFAAPRIYSPEKKSKSQAQIRREIFQRAHNQCENCHSTFALEIDHIRPKALGGDDLQTNLRLLCRSCNQRAAIKVLGANKMEKYLQS
jgi:5-methylcytosine-specific restriction endonuclease McrA